MRSSFHDDGFISGIYNYCDRWCERCEFTDRCRVFADDRLFPDDQATPEEFVEQLSEVFAETKQMLLDKADELGIDPFAISDEEFAEIRQREKRFVDRDELSLLGDRYWRSARRLLDTDSSWSASFDTDDKLTSDVIEVLNWYLFFIPVKVKSALHGLLDDDGFEDTDQRRNTQSYANGTAKVALIAVERSILAWTYLLDADQSGAASRMVELLEQIKCGLESRFPCAREFIRPGFDEVAAVM